MTATACHATATACDDPAPAHLRSGPPRLRWPCDARVCPSACERPVSARTAAALALSALALLAIALPSPAVAAAGWTWPVTGEIITAYSNGEDPYAAGRHRGIDIAAAPGTPVAAAVAGTVRFAGVAGSSGLTVSVRTADGRFDTSYLHLAAIQVRKGDRVSLGRRIGVVGTSGRRSAPAPHLHFGVREAGTRHAYHDPLGLLPPPGTPPLREGPRGVPAPVGLPVRVAPAPEPVRTRSPSRTGRRAPARRRVRVPARRRIRVPAGGRAPLPRLGPSPFPAPVRAAPPRAVPGDAPRHGRSPSLGPAAAPEPRPLAAPERVPTDRPHPSPHADEGPDLGWALACAGLLLAAACLGRPGSRASGPERRRATARPRGSLVSLLGRR